MSARPRATLLYHFFHPDEVVSARQFSGLAEGLTQRGWDVTACTSNRDWHDTNRAYPKQENWNGVDIRRTWRPALSQSSAKGRAVNIAWMLANWTARSVFRGFNRPDVVVLGTDPVLSVLIASKLKLFQPRVKVAHWLFDLYPEAAVADGLLKRNGLPDRAIRWLAKRAYRSCDLIADIGPCMRDRLLAYDPPGKLTTLVPWALAEPERLISPDPTVRGDLFGSAKLTLLYSGSFGRAHTYEEFLALARRLRGSGVCFNFAGRGHRAKELRAAITPDDINIRFAGFASESELELRLTAADIHLASLRDDWTGLVVPSKFFGSLAAGRPVLFAGSARAGIARWIREFGVGWHLSDETVEAVADELRRLADRPLELAALQDRCRTVYQTQFAKRRILDGWDAQLRALLQ